jgi:MFS family permease
LFAALGSFVMGAGLGLLSTPLIVGLQSIVGWNRRGVVTGSNMFARQLGQTVGAAIFGSIANTVLANWLAHAPSSLARQLPKSIDITNQASGSSQHLSPEVAAFLKEGLYLASHSVFLALGVFAVVGIVALLFTPNHFKPLHFPEDDQQQSEWNSEASVTMPE